MLRFTLFAALLGMVATPVHAQAGEAPLFQGAALADVDLADQRAGFELPGGIQVVLAAAVTTDVNGQRLLQTTLQLQPGSATATAQEVGGAAVAIDPRGATATAALPGLIVQHSIGSRIGSLVANSGDGRVIDTLVQVDLSLSNVQPMALGSTVFRVQSIGVDAAILRATGG